MATSCRHPSTTRAARARSAPPSPTPVRDAATRDDSHYALGSVLNHVLLHQTVIGLEAKEQLGLAGERYPDVVIGSCGGGSTSVADRFPFVPDEAVKLVAVEPSSCPRSPRHLRVRLRRPAGMTPLLPMYTLGTSSSHLRSMPAGCATTATRRSSRTW